jgi:uncharacterized damage-inducible protein DinB
MSQASHYQIQFKYHFHVIRRLVECATKLSDIDLHENPGYGRGSIYDLFFHILRADQSWRVALETGVQTSPLVAEEYPDLEMLQAGFDCEEMAWQAYLEAVQDAQIDEVLPLTTRHGKEMPFVHWRILQHVLFHGMQHQAELAQALTQKGQSPGDLDFLFYRDEKKTDH